MRARGPRQEPATPWLGAVPTGPVVFNPLLRTAAELVAESVQAADQGGTPQQAA